MSFSNSAYLQVETSLKVFRIKAFRGIAVWLKQDCYAHLKTLLNIVKPLSGLCLFLWSLWWYYITLSSGYRLGRGHGFEDLEYAVMRSMGVIDETTPIITTVQDCQLVDIPDELMEEHDFDVSRPCWWLKWIWPISSAANLSFQYYSLKVEHSLWLIGVTLNFVVVVLTFQVDLH